eukprot:m.122462 g.122462  ORF g.122462 m.122462 type:complete len:498 (-) comp11107_c0_seq1:109-1602(-)
MPPVALDLSPDSPNLFNNFTTPVQLSPSALKTLSGQSPSATAPTTLGACSPKSDGLGSPLFGPRLAHPRGSVVAVSSFLDGIKRWQRDDPPMPKMMTSLSRSSSAATLSAEAGATPTRVAAPTSTSTSTSSSRGSRFDGFSLHRASSIRSDTTVTPRLSMVSIPEIDDNFLMEVSATFDGTDLFDNLETPASSSATSSTAMAMTASAGTALNNDLGTTPMATTPTTDGLPKRRLSAWCSALGAPWVTSMDTTTDASTDEDDRSVSPTNDSVSSYDTGRSESVDTARSESVDQDLYCRPDSISSVSTAGELGNDLAQILQLNFNELDVIPQLFDGTEEIPQAAPVPTEPFQAPTLPSGLRLAPSPSARRERRSPSRPNKREATHPRVEKTTATKSRTRKRHKHPCPYCDKCLDTKYKLERHVRTHTGEKPFQCEVCMTRFNQKSSLKTHSTIHAKAMLRDPGATKEMIENYTVNGHTFEALGIPYASFVYDAIQKQSD